MSRHPMQPVEWDGNGVLRFKENAIVRWMLDQATEAGLFSLNTIAAQHFSADDQTQLAQLIGYSVSGFADLSYVDDEAYAEAEDMAAALRLAHPSDPVSK